MDSITKKLQRKELQMLKNLSVIMHDNNIPFFLACGTALGCARHQGFIPWDDDIDIYIWGTDYQKLKDVFTTKETGNLVLHDYSTVKNYPYTFPKIVAKDTTLIEKPLEHINYECGVYIDLFPLFYANNCSTLRVINEFIRYFRYCLVRAYYFNFKTIRRKIICKIVHTFINPQKVQQKIFNEYKKIRPHGYYLITPCVFGKTALIESKYFMSKRDMLFEGALFPMPIKYESYLCNRYGAYMQLPPVEERVSNHSFTKLIFNNEENG